MTTTEQTAAITPALQLEVEQFLFHEAQLVDDRHFDEWLELFTDDTHYWVPTRYNLGRRQTRDSSTPDELAHFDDTKQTLGFRVARLRSGFAWAEQPPSRTRRLIGNVRIEPPASDSELEVRSNFILYCNRFETDVEIFAGERTDVLRRAEGDWAIASRTVLLDQTVILANSLSVFF
jgi:biphenyl 2,3-dioxygenase beta subunit